MPPLPGLTRCEASCSSGGGSPDLCLAALEVALTPLLLRMGLSRGRRLRSTTRSGALARSATPAGSVHVYVCPGEAQGPAHPGMELAAPEPNLPTSPASASQRSILLSTNCFKTQ